MPRSDKMMILAPFCIASEFLERIDSIAFSSPLLSFGLKSISMVLEDKPLRSHFFIFASSWLSITGLFKVICDNALGFLKKDFFLLRWLLSMKSLILL
ncbi:MAG: hypothetical protein CM1200mP3_15790 [Chloroflexota bacterium]|nr:MAG: hypothetical protein CM1200mP3_15790 [Chloroflexota bacterium]